MKNFLLLLSLYFSFSAPGLCAQELNIPTEEGDSIPTTFSLLKKDVVYGLGGFTNAFTQPLRWQKDDFLLAGGIALGTAALYTFDQESSSFFMEQREEVPSFLREIGEHGSPENFMALNGGVYLLGLFTKNEEIRETGLLLITSSAAAAFITSLGKQAIGRARPDSGLGKDSFDLFTSEESHHSFPSGHTVLSVTTAYAIGKQFKNPYLKAGIYGLGLISPASRLWEGAHWLTDVTLSIALGVAIVDGVDNYLQKRKEKDSGSLGGIDWNLQLGPGEIGLRGTF